MLGEVEWLYEFEEYPGDLEPSCGTVGAVRVVVRAAGCAIANGLGGGIMVRGDCPLDPGGVLRMLTGNQSACRRPSMKVKLPLWKKKLRVSYRGCGEGVSGFGSSRAQPYYERANGVNSS